MFALPTQLIDYRRALEARSEELKIARFSRIPASRDLFGHMIAVLSWGRIGRTSMGLTVSLADEDAARNAFNGLWPSAPAPGGG